LHYYLHFYPALADLRLDSCPDAYFFQKTVAMLVMMVATDVADRSVEEQQRMIDRALCIPRRMFSLLTSVLSPVDFFCAVIPVLHDCSPCNLLGAAIPRLAGRNCTQRWR
jgi:hypothetical protein